MPTVIPWLPDADPDPAQGADADFPPTEQALGPDSDAPGLLCAGGRLTPPRLEAAYRRGIFPWFSPGQPPLWWSTDPRMVLPVADFKLAPSLRKTLRRFLADPACAIRFDHDCPAVIAACASTPRAGQQGTWIVPGLQRAYGDWHRQGRVHSVETWVDGRRVGGLYCVALGRMLYGESMFAHARDASKIALAALVAFARATGRPLIDCQQETAHLASLGARPWPRAVFEAALHTAVEAADAPGPGPGPWTYDPAHWATLGLEAPGPSSTAAAPARSAVPPSLP